MQCKNDCPYYPLMNSDLGEIWHGASMGSSTVMERNCQYTPLKRLKMQRRGNVIFDRRKTQGTTPITSNFMTVVRTAI
ncbi:hypothetical protein Gorai_014136, partial [Gossypium raimondii]|nr:hypothetical protein [Gossypium raimondii]